MGEEAQVTSTSKVDIDRINKLLVGNSTRLLNAGIQRIQRRLLVLTTRLTELRNNEAIIKARIYNNVLETTFNAGTNTQVDPLQTYDKINNFTHPDQALNYAKFQQYSQSVGVKELDSELNRINAEIKDILFLIKTYEIKLTEFQDALTKAGQAKSNNLINRINKAINPTSADFQKDEIARSIIYNLMLLYRLAVAYKDNITNTETHKTGYPDEQKLPEILLKIRQVFWATAQQFSQFLQDDKDKGYIKLDFDNPGNVMNLTAIEKELNVYRTAGMNNKISADVDQFVKDCLVIQNGPHISRGIGRAPEIPLSLDNSMNYKTRTYPAVALRLGNNYIGSFEISSLQNCIKKWWKTKNAQFLDLPLCPNVVKPSPTSTDDKQIEAEIALEKQKADGADAFKKALDDARAQQKVRNSEVKVPDWVVQYMNLYGDVDHGNVNVEGKSSFVTHSFNKGGEVSALLDAASVLYEGGVQIRKIGTIQTSFTYFEDGVFQAYVVWTNITPPAITSSGNNPQEFRLTQ